MLGMVILGGTLSRSHGQVPREEAALKASSESALRNEDIIKLTKAGIDDATIVAKVATSKCQFDTSPDALIGLRQSGVSSAVLRAMVMAARPAASAPIGTPDLLGMKTARGDLGVQSGLIATDATELAALKEVSEHTYTEFKLTVANRNDKAPHKVGDVSILLKSTDPKHNKYTIELTAADKTVEKRDRNLNEPVQFMLSRARLPYELVVNDIKKDFIAGYISAPRVQQPR